MGIIKTATIKREDGKWYVVFSCVLPDVPIVETGKPLIGIDMGLVSFITTSDGEKESNPRYLKEALPVLKRKDRSVARKKRGGSNRRKAVRKLQKVYERVRNLRREHHHQVACKLVRRYGFIAVENLSIPNMLKNGRLSQAISDVAWGNFLLTLRSKAESAGVAYVEVNPRGTSQECSGCGAEVCKDLKVRIHDCPSCGLSLDRDENAARNILARGLLAWTKPAGLNVVQKDERAPRNRSRKATA
jgi:putative transposase